ncbi:L-aspartate oxidase [Cytobacillus sp. FJAT-54145]|uniref:L-aspartate oxidase n=1 Tax=Cytobacillus spartinae TaxID=3299023 RepID=A0ABW6KH19_9BACI
MRRTNVLIIGSGIAALQLAKRLRRDMNVIILTKSKVKHGNSYMAQGGVAAAMSSSDDPYKHFLDTLEAGRYHNNREIVLKMTEEAPALIRELFDEGCRFDTDDKGKLLLGMEGAHSEKRIVHGGGDATGQRMMNFLIDTVSHVQIIEDITVYELITKNNLCVGVKGKYNDGTREQIYADHIVLATGGLGQIYSFTSNAETVTGDGIALAYRVGAEIADMEFIQFHPTLLNINGQGKGLVSEAVRGEGAKLVTEDGTEIMNGVHPFKDLAPRHVVSQTIYDYVKKGKTVYLDISSIEKFESKFPTITALCHENDIDLNKGKIPVIPGCHFLMGGVKTDLYGRTNIDRLYAIGEVACTGIHGANRLASNSLLEGLFFGKNLAQYLNLKFDHSSTSDMYRSDIFMCEKNALHLPEVATIKDKMMSNAGIVRSKEGLMNQIEWLAGFDIHNLVEMDLDHLSSEDITKVFMLITSWLVTDSALKRTESRGGHFRADFPQENDDRWKQNQIIQKRLAVKGDRDEQIKAAVAT